jgi:MATE family multidrug resistance protein
MLVFRDVVVGFYTNDPSVKAIAISMLLMAAIFQIADGVQIGAAGALRGFKDTRVPMGINIVAYWLLAFPMAYIVTVQMRLEPAYTWAAFVVGLGAAALLLSWRFARLSRNYPGD